MIEPAIFERYFIGQFFTMCEDQVAQVREVCAEACYPIAKSFSAHPELIGRFMERVRAFKQSRKYTMRQTFILMCESVTQSTDSDKDEFGKSKSEVIFKEHFLESFIELQCDKIVNVRLMLSYTLANLFEKNEQM